MAPWAFRNSEVSLLREASGGDLLNSLNAVNWGWSDTSTRPLHPQHRLASTLQAISATLGSGPL